MPNGLIQYLLCPYWASCNTVMMTPSCHRVLSTFEHREHSDLSLEQHSRCILLDLLLWEYPPVLPLSSWCSFLLTDQYQFGQKHLRCLLSWYCVVASITSVMIVASWFTVGLVASCFVMNWRCVLPFAQVLALIHPHLLHPKNEDLHRMLSFCLWHIVDSNVTKYYSNMYLFNFIYSCFSPLFAKFLDPSLQTIVLDECVVGVTYHVGQNSWIVHSVFFSVLCFNL